MIIPNHRKILVEVDGSRKNSTISLFAEGLTPSIDLFLKTRRLALFSERHLPHICCHQALETVEQNPLYQTPFPPGVGGGDSLKSRTIRIKKMQLWQ